MNLDTITRKAYTKAHCLPMNGANEKLLCIGIYNKMEEIIGAHLTVHKVTLANTKTRENGFTTSKSP